jgi:hypothetical protein
MYWMANKKITRHKGTANIAYKFKRRCFLGKHTICFLMRSSRSSSEISPNCKTDSYNTVSAKSFSGPVPHLAAIDSPNIGTKYPLITADKGCNKT